MNKYKIDLHTHSIISHDGGLTEAQYTKLIKTQVLDYIAITDHNETRFARIMQQKLGERIIVGEEIGTTAGEIIGLFLKETIPGGLTPEETVHAIKAQGGLVYIPHPYETFRKGLQQEALERIAKDIALFEIFNGRGRWRGKNNLAMQFARLHNIVGAASSDAHCILGIGKTYTMIDKIPQENNLTMLFQNADLQKEYAPLISLLCPVVNKIKNKVVL